MAKICYTKNGNKKSLLSLTEKITTPSIKIVGPEGTFYTPLFNSTAATVDKDRYRYTLTNFKVGNYRAAESRAWINRAPVIRLNNVPDKYGRYSVSFNIEYGDEDHDNCTIEYGHIRAYYGNADYVRAGSLSVSTPNNVSSSNYGQTKSVTLSADGISTIDANSINNQSVFGDGRTFTTKYCAVYAKITDANGESATAIKRFEYVERPTITYKNVVTSIAPGMTVNIKADFVGPDNDKYYKYSDHYVTYESGSWSRTTDWPLGQVMSNSNIYCQQVLEKFVYDNNYEYQLIFFISGQNAYGLSNKVNARCSVSDSYGNKVRTTSPGVTISTNNYLYLLQHISAQYLGSISDDLQLNIINRASVHGGEPRLMIVGLPASWVGKTVYWQIVQDKIWNTTQTVESNFPDMTFYSRKNTTYPFGTATVTDTDYLPSGIRLVNGQNPVDANLKKNSDNTGFKPNYSGWIEIGKGFLPYGKYSIIVYRDYESGRNTTPYANGPVGYGDIYCCHIVNQLEGHGSVRIDKYNDCYNKWMHGNP